MSNIYTSGKIYRLICIDGHYYIGSTTQKLNLRFNAHKQSGKVSPETQVYKYINSVGWDKVEIELLEEYPCKTKKELSAREDYYIKAALDNTLCLNTIRSYTTKEEKLENMKEYYQEHKEEIMDYQRFYGTVNKEKVDEYQENYRKENAEKRREYTRKYNEEHPEWKKQYRKEYVEKNKEKVTEAHKKYVQENKEKVSARKLAWALRKREENADTIVEERAKKREARKQKSAARIEHDNTIVKCECGGSYQNYRKKRHDNSKTHLAYAAKLQTNQYTPSEVPA